MNVSFSHVVIVLGVTVLGVTVLAALGGALAVFSEFDDAPGGILLGLVLVAGAAALGLRATQRRR